MDNKKYVIAILRDKFSVSRETLNLFELYIDLIQKWNKKFNLMGVNEFPDIWERHILDSAQLVSYMQPNKFEVVDFGSGCGFPSIILALMGIKNITVIERSKKKCSFLTVVAAELGVEIKIINDDIANVVDMKADVIISRAFASLKTIINLGEKFFHQDTRFILHKGKNSVNEINEAKLGWDFNVVIDKSIFSKNSYILQITGIKKKG